MRMHNDKMSLSAVVSGLAPQQCVTGGPAPCRCFANPRTARNKWSLTLILILFSLPSWGGEILTIDNGKVVAGHADGDKRQVLVSSQLLSKYKVRELFDWKDLPNKNSR